MSEHCDKHNYDLHWSDIDCPYCQLTQITSERDEAKKMYSDCCNDLIKHGEICHREGREFARDKIKTLESELATAREEITLLKKQNVAIQAKWDEQDGEAVEQYCSNCGAVLPWHESQCAKDPDYGDDEDE